MGLPLTWSPENPGGPARPGGAQLAAGAAKAAGKLVDATES